MQMLRATRSIRPTKTLTTRYNSSSVQALQAAFKDSSSPFYLAPGEAGPASEGLTTGSTDSALKPNVADRSGSSDQNALPFVENHAVQDGYDRLSFWEQRICWGDLDSFRHLNNVRYCRFIESARMKYMTELAHALSPDHAQRMLAGKGKSLILKSMDINFKRPVNYPDTLLVALRLHNLQSSRFHLAASLYSTAQRAPVAHSDSVCVWYDYDTLRKCEMPPEFQSILEYRVSLGESAKSQTKQSE